MPIILSGGSYNIPASSTVKYHPGAREYSGGALGFLKRGINFFKNNLGRILRSGVKLLPDIVDNVVRRNNVMPESHKRKYENIKKHLKFLPGLLGPYIDRLDKKYAAQVERPMDKTDATLDELGKKGLKIIEDKISKAFPAVEKKQEGGGVKKRKATNRKAKPRDSKGRYIKTSGNTVKSSNVSNDTGDPMDSDEFRAVIRGLIKGNGVVTSMT